MLPRWRLVDGAYVDAERKRACCAAWRFRAPALRCCLRMRAWDAASGSAIACAMGSHHSNDAAGATKLMWCRDNFVAERDTVSCVVVCNWPEAVTCLEKPQMLMQYVAGCFGKVVGGRRELAGQRYRAYDALFCS